MLERDVVLTHRSLTHVGRRWDGARVALSYGLWWNVIVAAILALVIPLTYALRGRTAEVTAPPRRETSRRIAPKSASWS